MPFHGAGQGSRGGQFRPRPGVDGGYDMQITRHEGYIAPILPGSVRPGGVQGGHSTESAEGSFDQITLSAPSDRNAFRQMVSDLSYQVRTHNTTGKIQQLRRQVSAGEYRPDAMETAARMLLLGEGE